MSDGQGLEAAAEGNKAGHLESIESLRGVAALMVLFFHLVLLVKIPAPAGFGFIASHFGFGVPLFFTLSGFVLAYGYADALASRAQIVNFYLRRIFRIAPLFYAALALWLAANWVMSGTTVSAQTLFLNVTFLFGLVPGQHQSVVWAGWSIGIEMLFYLLFPVFAVLVSSVRSSLVAFVVSCVVSAAVYRALVAAGQPSYAYMNLGTHLPFFVAGMGCYRCWQATRFARLPVPGWGLLAAAVLLVVALTASPRVHMAVASIGFERNIWAIVFALVILSVCLARNPLLESAPLRHLGKLSYSVYLLHPMVMAALIWLQFPARIATLGLGPLASFLLAAIVAVGTVWAGSLLSFRWVEQPGMALGHRLTRRAADHPGTLAKAGVDLLPSTGSGVGRSLLYGAETGEKI